MDSAWASMEIKSTRGPCPSALTLTGRYDLGHVNNHLDTFIILNSSFCYTLFHLLRLNSILLCCSCLYSVWHWSQTPEEVCKGWIQGPVLTNTANIDIAITQASSKSGRPRNIQKGESRKVIQYSTSLKIQQQFRFLNAVQGIAGFENLWFT